MPVTRKRPAPGTSPLNPREQLAKDNRTASPEVVQTNNLDWQYPSQGMANDDLNHQAPDISTSYQNNVQPMEQQNAQYLSSTAQQLTRRPYNGNQNLVQAQSNAYTGNGQWADNGGQAPTGDWPVQYDELDQRAEVAKRDLQAKRKLIPPFIQKLSSFLDEDRNTDLIRWSDSGDSFIVLDEDEFAKTLVPELFKHNKYASFVRQLNMYGFHKKVGLSDNSMRASERKNKNPSEYSNPYFKRGRPNLLWLIHKPKNPPGKGPGKGRNKQDDFDEEVDETFARDNSPIPPNPDLLDSSASFRQQPLLTMGSMADRLPQSELSSLRRELREVQQNQMAIREMLRQTRQEHQQLYGQAKAFHELHEKHDNSINAILSFLATVYNKNLAAGQAGAGEMFPGAIPPKEQPHGNVVDMGDEKEQTQQPFRKPQLLLEAGNASSPTSPANSKARRRPSRQDSNTLLPNNQVHSPAVQELSDNAQTPSNRSSQSPRMYAKDTTTADSSKRQMPESDILRMINNASSGGNKTSNTTMQMDFPEALNHLQTADGSNPLTPNQRQNVLQLMGNDLSTAASPTNNGQAQALTLPNNPGTLDNASSNNLANFDWSADQLSRLEPLLRQQEESISSLHNSIAPLSPSGSIPGVTDGQFNHPSPGQDLSWALNDYPAGGGEYFGDGAMGMGGGLNFDPGLPDFDFSMPGDDTGVAGSVPGVGVQDEVDENVQGAVDDDAQKLGEVETVGSSEATSPAETVKDLQQIGSPGKRRRRN